MIANIKKIIILSFVFLTPLIISANKLDFLPYGKWTVYSYKLGDTSIGLSEKEIKGYLGKNLLLNKRSVSFNEDLCNAPVYKLELINDDYLKTNYKIDHKFFSTEKTEFTTIAITCSESALYKSEKSPNFSYELIMVSKNVMAVNIMGVFFYLKKGV